MLSFDLVRDHSARGPRGPAQHPAAHPPSPTSTTTAPTAASTATAATTTTADSDPAYRLGGNDPTGKSKGLSYIYTDSGDVNLKL